MLRTTENQNVSKYKKYTKLFFYFCTYLPSISLSLSLSFSPYPFLSLSLSLSLYTYEELWFNETVCLWMTIYTLPSRGLSTLAKELTAATRLMQRSSNARSTTVSDCPECKQTTAKAECVKFPSLRRSPKWLCKILSIV